MAIRKNTNPRMMDLQPEMQDILRRNGMQAQWSATARATGSWCRATIRRC